MLAALWLLAREPTSAAQQLFFRPDGHAALLMGPSIHALLASLAASSAICTSATASAFPTASASAASVSSA